MTEKIATIATWLGAPPIPEMMRSPTHFESPVVYIMPPMARPPPKSISVPHSIPSIASCQSRVKRRILKFTGMRNSSKAPAIAATASGNSLLYIFSTGLPDPIVIDRIPGVIHRTTATMKQNSVFFCARVHLPSSASFSWINFSAPSMRSTSAGNICESTRYAMMK